MRIVVHFKSILRFENSSWIFIAHNNIMLENIMLRETTHRTEKMQ